MPVEVSCVDCVKVSWQILFNVQFARWRIVDVVYDVLLPVVWPDMNALNLSDGPLIIMSLTLVVMTIKNMFL